MRKHLIPVFFTYDEEDKQGCLNAVTSFLNYIDDNREYRIHILYRKISGIEQAKFIALEKNNVSICLNDISLNIVRLINKLPQNSVYSFNFLSSLIIPVEFPLYNKALFINSGTNIETNIDRLYDLNLHQNLIAGFRSKIISKQEKEYLEKVLHLKANRYFSDEVLLLNTKKCRELKTLDQFIDINYFYSFSRSVIECDYYNFIFKNNVKYFPSSLIVSYNQDRDINYVFKRKEHISTEDIHNKDRSLKLNKLSKLAVK